MVQFSESHHLLSMCLSEETLKASGPFYLVYMEGEVKYNTGGKRVACRQCSRLTNSRGQL